MNRSRTLSLILPSRILLLVLIAWVPVLFAGPAPAQDNDDPTFEDLRQQFEQERSLPYNQRYNTVNQMGNFKTDEAAAFLFSIYEDQNEHSFIRRYALTACGRCARPAFKDRLVAVFHNEEDDTLRGAAIQALGSYGEDAPVDVLTEALASDSRSAAQSAVTALSQADPPNLGEILRDHVEDAARHGGYVLVNLLRNLARIGHEDWQELSLQYLDTMEGDTSGTYRGQLVDVLLDYGRPNDVLPPVLRHADSDESRFLSAMRRALGDAFYPPDNPDTEQAEHRIRRFEGVRWLEENGFEQESPQARGFGAAILSHYGDREPARAALIAAIEDEDEESELLIEFIDALISMGSTACDEAFELLMDFADSRVDDLEIVAIMALGYCQGHAQDEDLDRLLSRTAHSRREVFKQAEAIVAMGRLRHPDTVDVAERALRSRDWRVRAAAIQALELCRDPEGVDLLIEQLEDEEGRLRGDIVRALQSLTGHDLPDDAQVWAQWWRANREGFQVPPPPDGDSPAQAVAGTSTGFYGMDVVSTRVCFVLDVSGSMNSSADYVPDGFQGSPNKLDVAKHELLRVLDSFEDLDDVKFNVIFFHTEFEAWQEHLVEANPRTLEGARQFVREQTPRGGTNIFDSLYEAMMDDEVDTIYLLSDGSPGSGKFVNPDDICREIRTANRRRRIVINCIGIQVAGSAETFLRRLARENNGNYVGR